MSWPSCPGLGVLPDCLVSGAVVEREVAYRGGEIGELQLAWASTVHKAQGSECPVVILALSPMHRPLLTRRLLYTGQPLPFMPAHPLC